MKEGQLALGPDGDRYYPIEVSSRGCACHHTRRHVTQHVTKGPRYYHSHHFLTAKGPQQAHSKTESADFLALDGNHVDPDIRVLFSARNQFADLPGVSRVVRPKMTTFGEGNKNASFFIER